MLMMNDFGPMAPGNMMPPSFNPMCQGLFEHQMPKPRLAFKMPRVVPDQKNKFQTDDLFKRLSRESDVSIIYEYTNIIIHNDAFVYFLKHVFFLVNVYYRSMLY